MAKHDYELFLDESGTFDEHLKGRSTADRQRRFASQFAGVLAPAGRLSNELAGTILHATFQGAGYELGERVHGTELRDRAKLYALVGGLVNELRKRSDLQPVRLVNEEAVSFGEVEATYTHMLAELVVRIFEALTKRHPNETVHLDIAYPIYMVRGQYQLDLAAYRKRLEEVVSLAQVQRGQASRAGNWSWRLRQQINSKDRRLQICDVLSYASHSNYRPLDQAPEEVLSALQKCFGSFAMSMQRRAVERRVDEHLEDSNQGMALILLAAAYAANPEDLGTSKSFQVRVEQVQTGLADCGDHERDMQLRAVVDWLELLVEQRAGLALGLRVASWLTETVLPRVHEQLGAAGQGLGWFEFALARLELTARNHRGHVLRAQVCVQRIEQALPTLVGRWEHADRVLQALIAVAVHRNDTFDFEGAAATMTAVEGYYGELASLFHAALPSVFPEQITSRRRGEALGTLLQSQMFAGLAEPNWLQAALQTSERALAEFEREDDVRRQQQYRAQLHTYRGEFQQALNWLARSLGLEANDEGESVSHEDVLERIVGLGGFAEGFATLHWLRLVAMELRSAVPHRVKALHVLCKSHKLTHLGWIAGDERAYPVHGILRQSAALQASLGNEKVALSQLGRLRGLVADENEEAVALRFTSAAACVEVAAALWQKLPKAARKLLEATGQRSGVRAQLSSLSKHVAPLATVAAEVKHWQNELGAVLAGAGEPAPRLWRLAARTPH